MGNLRGRGVEIDSCENQAVVKEEDAVPRKGKEINEILSLAHLIAELCLESPLKSERAIETAMDFAGRLVKAQMSEDYEKRFR